MNKGINNTNIISSNDILNTNNDNNLISPLKKISTLLLSIIKLIRVKQYTKNCFIFIPIFFGFNQISIDVFMRAFLAFIGFSFIASSVYIFNDIIDCESDKNHPNKKNRPIANGTISKHFASALLVIFFTIGNLILGLLDARLLIFSLVYAGINYFYTIKLKHISLLDIFILATGFLIRLLIGSIATNISISMWIIVMTFILCLFLAIAKRREDVKIFVEKGIKLRKSVEGYNLEFINLSMIILASTAIVAYVMYTISPDTHQSYGTSSLYLTSFFVILGVLRYLQIALTSTSRTDPSHILLKDKKLLCTIIAWATSYVVIVKIQI